MIEKVTDNSYFVYSEELEYLLAAMALVNSYHKNECVEKMVVAPEKKRFQVLQEVFNGMTDELWGAFLEPLVLYFPKEFSLDQYESFLLEMKRSTFLANFLQDSESNIEEVISGKVSVMEYYQKHSELFNNYLPCSVIFEKTEWFVHEYFTFIRSLQSNKIDTYIKKQKTLILKQQEVLIQKLQKKEALAVSEEIMGKTFYNRGPYEDFYFMPSFFLPARSCRLHEKYQVLLYNMNATKGTDRDIPQVLKAMADPTRYAILKLLTTQTHLSGLEIAERMGLATSTISHHMTQLKSAGLVNEEPAKNTKLYSLNKDCMEKSVHYLEQVFLAK